MILTYPGYRLLPPEWVKLAVMKISEAVISAATESIHWPEWTTLVANSNGMRYDPEPSAAGVPTVIPSLVKKSRDFRSEHPASARTL